ncbi:unnamed protein product [Amoebophrya sp. A120]|nr:unnamed protein product [Amoebophrya sp. A120]|eukprot:GSA120T00001676001.1
MATVASSSSSSSSSTTKTAKSENVGINKVVSFEELKKHDQPNDLWIAINGQVYDLTKFSQLHPGGRAVLLAVAGKDASKQFYALHNKAILDKYKRLRVGSLENFAAEDAIPSAAEEDVVSEVPYAEAPLNREGWAVSPYMNDSHKEFYRACREFVKHELLEDAVEGELADEYPTKEVYEKMGAFGYLASRIGTAAMPLAKELGIKLPANVSPDDFDVFHEMLAHEALGRLRQPGYGDGLGAGLCIGLPPVLIFSKPDLAQTVASECLLGQKRICLAISEPSAGSDVARIELTGKKSACGGYYILNGVKKWITNGMFSDYFVTAVRTGGPGMKGISMMLVPRNAKQLANNQGNDVTTKQIQTSYSKCAGTALVMYDDVYVPVANLMGKENQGFKCIMANFNHERWFISCQCLGIMRQLVQETFQWAMQREVFGKILAEEPVIRQKLAKMIAAVEAVQSNLEQITYQMHKMDYFTQVAKLAGPISFLKYNTTRTMTMLADEACQVFGGRAITKTGLGDGCEKFNRTYKFASILGGSEEIMADLGVRMAMRDFPAKARL